MKQFLRIALLSLLLFATTLPVFSQQRHKVGIVLSGGGALGFAHIGVLQALEESGIRPTIVAGASMGSLIGSFYALGMRPMEIFRVVKSEEFDHTVNILAPIIKRGQLGISSQKNIIKILSTYIPHNSFDSLAMPLYVSVTNLSTSESEFRHTGGNLYSYLLASSAIPGVFEAVSIDSMIYVDGGVLNNFPSQAIRDQCDLLIGVDVNPDFEYNNPSGLVNILGRTLHTLIHHNSIPGRRLCNFLIEPEAGKIYTAMSFDAFDEIYQYGYQAGKAYIAAHPELVTRAADR